MPGLLAHVGALTNCPHAGTIPPQPPSSPRVFVNGGQPVLTFIDLITVAGCPFQIPNPVAATPPTIPHPCVTVRLEASKKVSISGSPALILTPTALCYSAEQMFQGPPNSSAIQKRILAT